MVYCKYMPHEPLPLGLLPGSIASFHFFSLKSSTRSGNMYCVNGSSSSITVEAIGEESTAKFDSRNKSHDFTQEMTCLAVTHIYDLTQRLLQGCLSREVVCVRGTVMAVLHAFIQFQCQACLCTMVDGLCRTACPAKRATLNTDARYVLYTRSLTQHSHTYIPHTLLVMYNKEVKCLKHCHLPNSIGHNNVFQKSYFSADFLSKMELEKLICT